MPVGVRGIDICDFLEQDRLAVQIVDYFNDWSNQRQPWLDNVAEVRDYVFAVDTTTTTNNVLPWKNSVHIPKLCQIRDNLHANYMATVKPNDDAIIWEGDDENAEAKDKREVIQSYMANKLRQSGFWNEASRVVYDWIDSGNCFAMVEYVSEQLKDPRTGMVTSGYVGPKMRRISYQDIVFNPAAASFEESPKIIRSIKTLASLKADLEDHPELGYMAEVFNKMREKRSQFVGLNERDFQKNTAFIVDGFGNFLEYFKGNYIEVLEFYGDLYDSENDKLYKDHIITVIDRSWIIRAQANPSWLGSAPIFHCGWRLRPDNLYAMGPLDNLVGMQYRIDHLENAKADAFDLIVQPVIKVKGYVEDFDYGPNERIFCGDDGEVEFMPPDTTMLNADTQIALYEQKMEEMAGAPKQAMGFRTPGEKTAFEMQILENGANKVFINKTSYFEEQFLEPILQCMLEQARRNLSPSDIIRVVDNDVNAVTFQTITREDITARGKIRPVGARHFAHNANIVQNLSQFQQMFGSDPSVMSHISGKAEAKLIEELLGLSKYKIYGENIRVAESYETQQLVQSAQTSIAQQGMPTNADQVVQPSPQG